MNQIVEAKKGNITDEMFAVSKYEKVNAEYIRQNVAKGRIVILKNNTRANCTPVAVGEGLKVKINANIGTSNEKSSIEEELEKVKVIEKYGADVLMDLSTGKYVDETRTTIIKATNLPIGTVPMYQAGKEALDEHKNISMLSKDKLFSDIEKQCKDGVDFITVHCGVTKFVIEQLEKQKRLTGIVSRGGSMLACWVKMTGRENPLYEYYDELLDLVKKYDVTLSLGDGLRPGCTNDANDRAQVAETIVLGELVKRARDFGVQAMVEGPGHVPLNQVSYAIKTIKQLTDYAPLYVLGPLVCDCAPGYDHITSAIGGAVAAMNGADFLCYVTPAEHISLPNAQQVKEGIISAKIAAHAADLARGNQEAVDKNFEISKARVELDWAGQIDNSIDRTVFDEFQIAKEGKPCTMCGSYCSMKLFRQHFDEK